MINMRKIRKVMAVLAVVALVCCGCGKEDAGASETPAGDSETEQSVEDMPEENGKEALSVEEVYQEIEREVSLKSPACMEEDFISNYYGMDTKALEEYVFSISEDAAQAETVIIMKVKDGEDMAKIAESLQAVVEEKKGEMENYIPEQFAIVEKSEVVTRDNYVWLVISENEDTITSVIENNLF